ncbi:hypothetical protein PybrP1_011138 [[Pythium] brassicae (nom. inval.)]|nr:hypothetical protein PybrP1_011138 [[Pythium] brassicae (nom. inval.)]
MPQAKLKTLVLRLLLWTFWLLSSSASAQLITTADTTTGISPQPPELSLDITPATTPSSGPETAAKSANLGSEASSLNARSRIRTPLDGSVNALPIRFSCMFEVDDNEEFMRRHGAQLLCVQVDGRLTGCRPVMETPPEFASLGVGSHSAIAFLVNSGDASTRFLQSEAVQFTVLADLEYREYVDQQRRQEREGLAIEDDEDLLTWASSQSLRTATLSPNGWANVNAAEQRLSTHVAEFGINDNSQRTYPDGTTQPDREQKPPPPLLRFYAGQVWAKQFLSPVLPVRDPNHKNYIFESQYPMKELLPFAFGPHFVLSMDCVEYIAENRDVLGNLSSLDDVSVALWLLALQVHPEHLSSFQNLRDSPCSEGLVSFADLNPSAIRVIHANLLAGAPLCRGFNVATWLKPLNNAGAERKIEIFIKVDLSTELLRVTTTVVLENRSSREFAFAPSLDRFEDHIATLAAFINEGHARAFEPGVIAEKVQDVMRRTAERLLEQKLCSAAHLFLWQHNLQIAMTAWRSPAESSCPRTVTVVYSTNGVYGKGILECVFATIYKQDLIQVMDEASFQAQQLAAGRTGNPDVFVFSILDGGCPSSWMQKCKSATRTLIDRYVNTSTLIMLSGEPWDIDDLDGRVLLLSTVAGVAREKYIHLPMASMGFTGIHRSPMLLRTAAAERYKPNPRKFCAYLYARCDRPQREYMFDLLNSLEPVDALGVCQGSTRSERRHRWGNRLMSWAFEESISVYEQYKFVIAFENAQTPGYSTEKLVTAFLAGSVPVYFGHSDSLYGRMLSEPAVGNVTRFHELFSWHPDVPSSYMADRIAALAALPTVTG